MSVEDIIRAWKADDDQDDQDDKEEKAPENPAGQQELSDKDLKEVSGGCGIGYTYKPTRVGPGCSDQC